MSSTPTIQASPSYQLAVRCHGETDIGRVRQNNEDNFLMLPERFIFAVADGMGGAKAGEVASAMALESLEEQAKISPSPTELYEPKDSDSAGDKVLNWIATAVRKSHKNIWKKSQKEAEMRGMGCTLDFLVLSQDRAFVGHVGDSRIYLIRRGRAYRVTQDHTLAQAQYAAGFLTEEELKTARTRNILLKAMGVAAEVEPDVFTFEIGPGDCFLLCSDGLYEYFQDTEIPKFFDEFELEQIPRKLIETACERGGHDNITAVVVEVLGGEKRSRARDPEEEAELVEQLAGLSLLESLSYEELLIFSRVGRKAQYGADDLLIVGGEETERLCIVLEGELLEGEKSRGVSIREGEAIGEGAILGSKPARFSLRAVQPTTVFLIDCEPFLGLLDKEPNLANKVLWSLLSQSKDRFKQRIQAYTQKNNIAKS
jgi:serine/threonine protein phosphatase PrpC